MCGVFAFLGQPPDPSVVIRALELIRHRGQDGFGFWIGGAASDQSSTMHYRQIGGGSPSMLGHLLHSGVRTLVAHWRYATRGDLGIENAQPVLLDGGHAAIAFNGQIQFSETPQQAADSDAVRLAAHVDRTLPDDLLLRLETALRQYSGAYSLIAAGAGRLISARDRFGIRPLFWARYPGGVALASETPALSLLRGREIAEVQEGTLIDWSPSGPRSQRSLAGAVPSPCAFEHVYFHGADGRLGGKPAAAIREDLGRELGRQRPAVGDLVTSVPNSGDPYATGYAAATGIPLRRVITMVAGSQRTFITSPPARKAAIEDKYAFDGRAVQGRSVILVDDSLVRGSTMRYVAAALRTLGAHQVHARIGSPSFRHPCYFGIDVPDRAELIGAQDTPLEIARRLGLDSLEFLSIESLRRVLGRGDYCLGCFTGRYPIGSIPMTRDLEFVT